MCFSNILYVILNILWHLHGINRRKLSIIMAIICHINCSLLWICNPFPMPVKLFPNCLVIYLYICAKDMVLGHMQHNTLVFLCVGEWRGMTRLHPFFPLSRQEIVKLGNCCERWVHNSGETVINNYIMSVFKYQIVSWSVKEWSVLIVCPRISSLLTTLSRWKKWESVVTA